MTTRRLIVAVMTVALMLTWLLATPAYAAIYWDDEMEVFTGTGHGTGGATTGGFNPLPTAAEPVWDNPNTLSPNDGVGIPGTLPMTATTATKFSGAGSLRYNYTDRCQVSDGTAGLTPCGGSSSRNFGVYAPEHYGRVYFRISNNFFWGAPNGQSKLWGVRSTQGVSKLWFNFGFSTSMLVSAENTPATGQTSNIYVNYSMPREQWVCLEWRIKANEPPGALNGELQFWVNGSSTPTISRNNISWRGVGNNSYLDYIHVYRQSGGPTPQQVSVNTNQVANLWFDRFAVGNTRVGCLGIVTDFTPPGTPAGWTVY